LIFVRSTNLGIRSRINSSSYSFISLSLDTHCWHCCQNRVSVFYEIFLSDGHIIFDVLFAFLILLSR